ncbi:MAG: leucine-rich repeat protein, partial [Thermoguttaceae bacterium]|nr:leucine-rich repeat protein [Thermoguttaceae bacterium]
MSDPLDKTEIFQEEFKRITPEKLAPGMFLGKEKNYRLEKFLGAGGMGHVWLAAEIEDGVELRKVVCKVIPSLVQREKKEMRKVLKTFHLVQPLSHPNICPIYGLKSDPICGYFFVMGYADGGTLDDWFHAQPGYADGLPVSQVAEVLRPIAQALDHAHEMGIVHRDVKPQNILFVKRREQKIPWLIDFGISSRIQQTTTQTMTEQGSSGTPAYMAPEQCQNETQDGRTDQYALGVLTYQLLSGHLPFSANNPLALWGQIVNMPAPPLTNVSAEVNSVVLRALSKNRKNRFASCVEFVDALTGKKPSKSSSWSLWLESSKLSALGAIRPAVEALKKRKWFLLAGFLVLLLIGISLFLISAKRDETAGSAASLSEIKKRAEDPLPVTNESDFEMYGTSLTKYKGRSAQVVIPSVIRGQKVKSIGESAFKDCRFLRFVEIPESVTGIGNDAFSGCVSLTSVFIPEGVTTIGLSAFSYCRSLKSVVIPEGVVEIGSKAFTRCGSLTSIVIPKGARVIPGSAFKGCASLSSVVISDGVRDIGPEAFQGCGLLTSVVIPESMKEIGEKAFQDCRSLTSVVIPEGVMRIGENVFSGCPKLTIYTPEDSNAELYARKNIIPFKVLQEDDSEPEPTSEDAAAAEPTSRDSFEWDGTKITKFIGKETDVIIPDDVTEIGDHVFDSCSFLKSVVIPDGVTKIGLGAFDSCLSLTSVTIPDSIKEIESGVFAGCMSLKEWPISSEHPYFKTDGTGLLT